MGDYQMSKIHCFSLNNKHLVLDIGSGAVYSVDAPAYALISALLPVDCVPESCPEKVQGEFCTAFPQEDLDECYAELRSLYQDGRLFSEDKLEQYVGKAYSADSPIKAMCLHIAHDCNLRCEYCFAAKGDFGTGRKLMSTETACAAMDFLVANSGNRRNLEVDFFGGEPLMNLNAVKQTVEYARGLEKTHDKLFRFTLTTNGLLLDDDAVDFINREMSNVVLSIDGRKAINDKLRPTPNGKGSYDLIVPKYRHLVEARGRQNYYVRGTFTKYNPDFCDDVMHLYELGFDQISVEPVVSDKLLSFALDERDLPRIFEEYERLMLKIEEIKADGGFINFFHFMLDLDGGPCAIKRMKGCGCGNEYVAVTPEGDIYPCHQFAGMEEWRMGTLMGGTLDRSIKERFAVAHIYTKEGCKDCWCRYFCSGGCNANNVQYMGDLLTPHSIGCELERKRVECALYLKA